MFNSFILFVYLKSVFSFHNRGQWVVRLFVLGRGFIEIFATNARMRVALATVSNIRTKGTRLYQRMLWHLSFMAGEAYNIQFTNVHLIQHWTHNQISKWSYKFEINRNFLFGGIVNYEKLKLIYHHFCNSFLILKSNLKWFKEIIIK